MWCEKKPRALTAFETAILTCGKTALYFKGHRIVQWAQKCIKVISSKTTARAARLCLCEFAALNLMAASEPQVPLMWCFVLYQLLLLRAAPTAGFLRRLQRLSRSTLQLEMQIKSCCFGYDIFCMDLFNVAVFRWDLWWSLISGGAGLFNLWHRKLEWLIINHSTAKISVLHVNNTFACVCGQGSQHRVS